MGAVVQIFIMRSGALEGTEMVSSDRFVIGRDPASAVVLDDPSVGARHLGVFVHDGKLAVQDLGAPGGSLINGAPIVSARYINPREDVVVGVYSLKFKLLPAKASAAPSPQSAAPPSAAPPSAAPQSAAPQSAAPQGPALQARSVMTAGHIGNDLERTLPGSHSPIDSSSVRSDDATTVDAQPSLPPRAMQAGAGLQFRFVDDDEHDLDDEPDEAWSLVERLVRQSGSAAGRQPVVEVVHYRGEHVVDHRVLRLGDRFVLGANWSEAQRLERGLSKPLPLVHLKKDGVAEIFMGESVAGKVLRHGVPMDLPTGGGSAPLVDGEMCSVRVAGERIFVCFAGVPVLAWSTDQLMEARSERRLVALSATVAVAVLMFMGALSWLYGYRAKSEDVIELGDDGFAEIVMKDLQFEEPPEKKPPPPPVKTTEPVPQKQPEPKSTPTAKVEPTPAPPPLAAEPPKPGLAAALQNIPKVNDSASNQNLSAALSNIKGVRVPGAQGGFKTSDLTGKGPSSGVQIGGAAGGVATSGINSLIRKDGAAGSLGGKGDRAVAGKVVTQPRLSQVKGTGELSKDEIQRVITAHVGEIQYCYEKQLRQNSGLAGRVVLEWVIAPSGAIGVVKVATSSLASAEATKCMMDRVKTWKFPKPRGNGGVTITYPFVFNTI